MSKKDNDPIPTILDPEEVKEGVSLAQLVYKTAREHTVARSTLLKFCEGLADDLVSAKTLFTWFLRKAGATEDQTAKEYVAAKVQKSRKKKRPARTPTAPAEGSKPADPVGQAVTLLGGFSTLMLKALVAGLHRRFPESLATILQVADEKPKAKAKVKVIQAVATA